MKQNTSSKYKPRGLKNTCDVTVIVCTVDVAVDVMLMILVVVSLLLSLPGGEVICNNNKENKCMQAVPHAIVLLQPCPINHYVLVGLDKIIH